MTNAESSLPWLRQVTRHRAIDHLRRRTRRDVTLPDTDGPDALVADPQAVRRKRSMRANRSACWPWHSTRSRPRAGSPAAVLPRRPAQPGRGRAAGPERWRRAQAVAAGAGTAARGTAAASGRDGRAQRAGPRLYRSRQFGTLARAEGGERGLGRGRAAQGRGQGGAGAAGCPGFSAGPDAGRGGLGSARVPAACAQRPGAAGAAAQRHRVRRADGYLYGRAVVVGARRVVGGADPRRGGGLLRGRSSRSPCEQRASSRATSQKTPCSAAAGTRDAVPRAGQRQPVAGRVAARRFVEVDERVYAAPQRTRHGARRDHSC